MKKIILLVTAFMLLAVPGFSQLGIKGGLNFTSFGDLDFSKIGEGGVKSTFDKRTGYHLGIAYKAEIPLIGLAIQPELLYSQVKGDIGINNGASTVVDHATMKLTYMQLPVSIQWGLDLMLLRPFIQAVPYIGVSFADDSITKIGLQWDVNKFRYGIGLGAGVDIGRLQVSGKYSWDLGKVAEFQYKKLPFKGSNNKGFELSMALFF